MLALSLPGELTNCSIWELATRDAFPIYRERNVHVDTAVVGAGLTGLSAAYHLLEASPGRQVVVLEAGQIGCGASSRSTGMLTPGIGQSLLSLIRRFGPELARALYRETLAAVAYVEQLVGRLHIDCQLRMTGQLIVPARRTRMRGRMQAQIGAFSQLDLPHEAWDLQTLSQRARFAAPPITDPRAETDPAVEPVALRLPTAGTLHPGLLLRGLTEHVLKLGGKIYERSKVTSVTGTSPATVLMSDGGSLTARNVIWATAGYDSTRSFFKGRVLPVHLGAIATEPLEPSQLAALNWPGRECVIDCRRLFNYYRLTQDNRIVFGGGAPRYRWGGALGQSEQSRRDLRLLAGELGEVFVELGQLQIAAAWTGVIGYVLDTFPTIRRLREKPAVIFVGPWSGHGIALGIQSGLWVRRWVDEGHAPSDLPWFTHKPPLLPTEPLRWCSFKTVVQIMALLDDFGAQRRAMSRGRFVGGGH